MENLTLLEMRVGNYFHRQFKLSNSAKSHRAKCNLSSKEREERSK